MDDNYLDGEEDDIKWTVNNVGERFDCKDLEWVPTDGTPIDYLGMLMSMDSERTYLEMYVYIQNCLEILEWTALRPVSRPMQDQINPDGDSPPLSPKKAMKFHTGLGMMGWLSSTCRPDISHAYSRLGQHQANPTESSLEALEYSFRYLKGSMYWCLSGLLNQPDISLSSKPVFSVAPDVSDQLGWEFFVDTDHAGNSEIQNKRLSQVGILAMYNDVPMYWKSSKINCYANSGFDEDHPDSSSGASETRGAGHATQDILHLSYVAREMGIKFPKPFLLQMDNDAARIFADATCSRSRMKHIDCALEWVRILRDKQICIPTRVSTENNLADMFTKILTVNRFRFLRSKLMYERPH